MLLAIDTSGGTSVAIVDLEAGIIVERSSADPRGHAEVIGTAIRECLDVWGGQVSELSGVVAGMGPGPFTGLRVGIAAARAFAFGAQKLVVPVASHDAIAFGATDPVIVITDARRHEVFTSSYAGMDAAGLPIRIDGPALAKAADVAAMHAAEGYRVLNGGLVSAGSLGMIAELLFANGRAFAPDEPIYLRSPDVTLSAGPKRVTS